MSVNGQVGDAENWTGNLIPGSIANYTMRSKLQIQESSDTRFVCVNLAFPDGFSDTNPQDNQLCASLSGDKFQVAPVFPNPAQTSLQLPVIVPSNGQVQVYVFSPDGIAVYELENQSVLKGVNRITIPLVDWANGLYFYKVVYQGSLQSGKFIKE